MRLKSSANYLSNRLVIYGTMTVFSLTKLDSVSHNNLKQNVTIDASSLKIQVSTKLSFIFLPLNLNR